MLVTNKRLSAVSVILPSFDLYNRHHILCPSLPPPLLWFIRWFSSVQEGVHGIQTLASKRQRVVLAPETEEQVRHSSNLQHYATISPHEFDNQDAVSSSPAYVSQNFEQETQPDDEVLIVSRISRSTVSYRICITDTGAYRKGPKLVSAITCSQTNRNACGKIKYCTFEAITSYKEASATTIKKRDSATKFCELLKIITHILSHISADTSERGRMGRWACKSISIRPGHAKREYPFNCVQSR